MRMVLEYEARVSRRKKRSKDGREYYIEYVVIPRSVRGLKSLFGKRVHVRIEVVEDDNS